MNEQKNESTLEKKGGISVETAHIFPVIKKWLYSEKDIFLRELVSNAADAVTNRDILHGRGCRGGQGGKIRKRREPRGRIGRRENGGEADQ